MQFNFSDLFNSNYLTRCSVRCESLIKHCPNFHAYIVAFDDACLQFFQVRQSIIATLQKNKF